MNNPPTPTPSPSEGVTALGEGRKRHAGGRPPKYTPAQWQQVASDIGLGMPVKYACVRAGVPLDSYEKKHQTDPEFFRAVEKAKADHLFTALQIISTDLPGHVGQRWLLERRHAADFHKPAEVQLNVQTDVHNHGFMLTPELQAQLAGIARKHFTKAGGRN